MKHQTTRWERLAFTAKTIITICKHYIYDFQSGGWWTRKEFGRIGEDKAEWQPSAEAASIPNLHGKITCIIGGTCATMEGA